MKDREEGGKRGTGSCLAGRGQCHLVLLHRVFKSLSSGTCLFSGTAGRLSDRKKGYFGAILQIPREGRKKFYTIFIDREYEKTIL